MSISQKRTCTKCGMVKPSNEFHKRRDSIGYQGVCKRCKSEQMKVYYREKVRNVRICRLCGEPMEAGSRRTSHLECRPKSSPVGVDKWTCAPDCKNWTACKEAMRRDKGCALPCFEMEAIPVQSWDVTSEFDGISLVKCEWEEG